MRGKRGATPVWLVCAVLCAGLGWLAKDLNRSADQAGFTTVDPARIAFEFSFGVRGLPEEWQELVALRLARLGELSALDEKLTQKVTAALETLPFVREVGEARVLWPDGLSLDIRLREPVACIRLEEDFLPVDSEGVVLPGYRPTPPDFGRGLLPVIGPVDASYHDFRPGDELLEAHQLDALSVAISMRENLSLRDLDLLGPVVIDATRARNASVTEPGVRLWLQSSRKVLYGRPACFEAAGELPERTKWDHVMRAIGYLSDASDSKGPSDSKGGRSDAPCDDWDLVDVRWDVPTLRPRLGYR